MRMNETYLQFYFLPAQFYGFDLEVYANSRDEGRVESIFRKPVNNMFSKLTYIMCAYSDPRRRRVLEERSA